MPTLPTVQPAASPSTFDGDVRAASKNALKLGLSLMATWGIALGIRILLPRRLGPELFGAFQFADAITSGLFVLVSLNVETYVRKEVATQRERASDFFGGLMLLQSGM